MTATSSQCSRKMSGQHGGGKQEGEEVFFHGGVSFRGWIGGRLLINRMRRSIADNAFPVRIQLGKPFAQRLFPVESFSVCPFRLAIPQFQYGVNEAGQVHPPAPSRLISAAKFVVWQPVHVCPFRRLNHFGWRAYIRPSLPFHRIQTSLAPCYRVAATGVFR